MVRAWNKDKPDSRTYLHVSDEGFVVDVDIPFEANLFQRLVETGYKGRTQEQMDKLGFRFEEQSAAQGK